MNQIFSTFDLGLSSTLVALGHELVELDRSHPTKVAFIFFDREQVEPVATQYYANQLEVPAQKLLATHRQLKDRIHAGV